MIEYLRLKKAFKELVKHKHRNMVVIDIKTRRYLKTKYREQLVKYCFENNIVERFNPVTYCYEYILQGGDDND